MLEMNKEDNEKEKTLNICAASDVTFLLSLFCGAWKMRYKINICNSCYTV